MIGAGNQHGQRYSFHSLTTRALKIRTMNKAICGNSALTLCWVAWLLTVNGVERANSQEKSLVDKAGATSSAPVANSSPLPTDTLVLVAPLSSNFVFLIDSSGAVRHQWKFNVAGSNGYLMPDGTLWRSAQEPEAELFDARGSFGRIQKVDWEGKLLWDFKYASNEQLQHHDFELLPNGNVLLIAWEKIPKDQALAAGRAPDKIEVDDLYSEKIVEIQPEGRDGGREVWSWRLWDHLVQDRDPQLPNYGQPKEHPRRVDINYVRDAKADWIHMNAVDYHAGFDQIIVSPRWFDELWIIDHSTTPEQSAASSGGRHMHGGDLLYRMGNPMSYGHGSSNDKLLFGQHNCMWIPSGFPGAGDITVFNNGTSPPRTGFSSVDQFKLPVDSAGSYRLAEDGRFDPPSVVWSYSRGPEMYSFRISGAERLASGNTLICSGDQPWILEVNPDKTVAWETRNRYGGGEQEHPKFEKGAMFRAPGYSLNYFEAEIQQKLR
jgi:hypothetical protein